MTTLVLRIVKNVPDKRGNLSHYGHFIHDFIVPVIHYINTSNNKYEHIYLENYTRWSSIGNFRSMAEKILGLKITELNTQDIDKLAILRTEISTISFGPYNPIFFKDIISYVKNTLTLTYSPYKVILIERGNSNPGSGAHRRCLSNHRQIQNKLSKYFGNIFKNIILEELTIDEQVSLFMNADIVIGQHGAGLCNIIWMTNPNSLVIEFPPHIICTFKNMCKAKDIKYKRLNPNAAKVIEVCQRLMPHITN
jgi:capsular polysaccharide biosynthesis protein